MNRILSKKNERFQNTKTYSRNMRAYCEQLPLKDVECDGRKITAAKDPPGQRSSYILPGDSYRETYRMMTFQTYPEKTPVNPCLLTSSGFYYTGYKDRVKCFSCGHAVDNWQTGDDPTSSRWHNFDCDFINDRDTRNIPIGSLFGKNTRKPHRRRIVPPSLESDSTLPSRVDATASEPPLPTSGGRIDYPGFRSEPPPDQDLENRVSLFPCLHPINPHMRSREARLQTFLDNASRWPSHRIRATPADIADAGMYYLGERDRVKCWYCNGGLQNWERDDSPWEEHAKWFPMCEFLHQQKGPEFTHNIVSKYPGLRRPTLQNPTPSGVNLTPSPNQSGPTIIDPQEELNKLKQKVEHEMLTSQLVVDASLMGFGRKLIKTTLKRRYRQQKMFFSSMESLVIAILEEEEKGNQFDDDKSNACQSSSRENSSSKLDWMKSETLCKTCLKSKACIVLIPCGHLASCAPCGDHQKKCPICKEQIDQKVHSYMS